MKDCEYWYYFGKCMSFPHQIKEGKLPRPPYKRFETYEECLAYINLGKTFDPLTEMLNHDTG
jgi:hypothetical protein